MKNIRFNDPTIDRAQKKVIEDIRNHFGEEYNMYINGEWVKGDSGTFNSTNPSNTNEVIGTFQLGTDQALGVLDAACVLKIGSILQQRNRNIY